jgi:hypothetical protein
MNNPAAEPRGFRFFCEKSVVGKEIFNTAWVANPKLVSVAISVTPQSLARETLSVRGFQPTRSDKRKRPYGLLNKNYCRRTVSAFIGDKDEKEFV